ncbi:serine hydrolase [Tistrella sp. BH-R2-4]|uniref:Serine hydrolase n=1 Tax=Tistrella arctica TaxID=3133430 RepID=A0ABU9YSN2_9PROT
MIRFPDSQSAPGLSRRRLLRTGTLAAGALTAGPLVWPRPLHAATGTPGPFDQAARDRLIDQARSFPTLHSLILARGEEVLIDRALRGPPTDQPVNVKSLSKTVIALLVGIAIDRGVLTGTDQRVADLLGDQMPADPDPRLDRLTIGHLLSMQAGLERTSGPNYGRWVQSSNWVRFALARDFIDEPGGRMLYSTGNTHLLSAILTKAARRSTFALARDWLGRPLDITIPPWPTDPQGIYFGGNQMLLSPRAVLAIGQMVRRGGTTADGRRVVSADWIATSWQPRATSPYTGDAYGYGWFTRDVGGMTGHYGWGYGGQMLYVVPDIGLVAVVTSDDDVPSGRTGYVRDLHGLIGDAVTAIA